MIKGNTSIKIGYFLMAVGVVVSLIGGIGAISEGKDGIEIVKGFLEGAIALSVGSLNYSVGIRNSRNGKYSAILKY